MNLPKGYLSVSQIKLYLQCPHKYKMRYIEGVSEPQTGPQTEGSVWSMTMEELCKSYLTKNKWHTQKQALAIWQKYWDQEEPKIVITQGTKANDAYHRARRFLRQLYVGRNPRLRPTMYDDKPGVELETDCEIAGVPFKVIPDLIEKDEEGLRLLDFKISNPDYQDVHRSIQLTFEAAVYEIERVSLLVGDKRDSNLIWMNGTRDLEGAWKYCEKLVTTVAEGITKGVFPLNNPEKNFLCSKKFCSHWKGCMGSYGF